MLDNNLKKGRGRPNNPENENLVCSVSFRLSQAELNWLRERAKKKRLGIGTLARLYMSERIEQLGDPRWPGGEENGGSWE